MLEINKLKTKKGFVTHFLNYFDLVTTQPKLFWRVGL